MSREDERLYELLNNAPTAQQSAETAQAAAQMAAAEQAAQNPNYSLTSDARLDRAITEYLKGSGYQYDPQQDAQYREFAKEYSNNALRGRTQAQETARQLAGGYEPSYADAVGSEVQGEIAANAVNYAPTFRQLAQQERNAQVQQAGNAAQVLDTMANTQYQRGREQQGDKMNYLNYLANRYNAARQFDAQGTENAGAVWRSQLSAASQNAEQARSINNARYQFGTQSAESAAKLAADQQAFNSNLQYQYDKLAVDQQQADQELQYKKAKDAYDDRVAAKKLAQQQEKLAQQQTKATETAKNKYQNMAASMMDIMEKSKNKGTEITAGQHYKYDLDGDGKLTDDDVKMAQQAAQTGQLAYTMKPTQKTSKVINVIETFSKAGVNDLKGAIEKTCQSHHLSMGEAAYVYQYFGL